MNERPTHIDLFSGIGGFALAADWAGFRTVAFCEIEPYCQAVIKARFGAVMADAAESRPHASAQARIHRSKESRGARNGQPERPRLHADIRTLDGTRYRGAAVLTGGFPCQPFSVAGKRGGEADDRFLWPEMLRVVSESRPAWIVGENVAGIINMELDRVLSDLEGIGYSVWPLVIPAVAVDARHRRDRVWIVANFTGSGLEGATRPILCGGIHRFTDGSEAVADSISEGLEVEQCEPRNDGSQQQAPERSGEGGCRWEPEPDVGRVAHGVSRRVDRLKGLGNAIVPEVAFQILKEIRKLT